MRKVIATMILGSSLLIAEPVYTKQDRINDMHSMAQAMIDIQTGFFFNNADIVAEGVFKLTDTITKVKPPLEKSEQEDPMTRYLNEKVKVTNKMVKDINKKAYLILERFKEGDTAQANQAYTKIMKTCMECHAQIRHW
jgi:hypothetical protein